VTKLKSSDTSEQDRQAMQWGCEMEHVWTLYHAIFLNDLQQILAYLSYFASWLITELVLAELMWSSEKDQLLFFGFIVASRQCFLILSYLKLTWVKKREVWPILLRAFGLSTGCQRQTKSPRASSCRLLPFSSLPILKILKVPQVDGLTFFAFLGFLVAIRFLRSTGASRAMAQEVSKGEALLAKATRDEATPATWSTRMRIA
jgi:hypothetical protein